MADPLRRTILAKLRGKKSKKVTAVAVNGDGEGKNVLPCGTSLIIADEGILRRTRRWESPLFLDEPCEKHQERSRVDVTKETGSCKNLWQMGSPFSPEQGRQVLPVPCYSLGDSIGFGTNEPHSVGGQWADGPCITLQSRGTDMDSVEDPNHKGAKPNKERGIQFHVDINVKHSCTSPAPQSHLILHGHQCPVSVLDGTSPPVLPQTCGCFVQGDSVSVSSVRSMYGSQAPQVYLQVDPCNVEEHVFIRNMESYSRSPGTEYKVSLQSPTVFPTKLEIHDKNVDYCPLEVRNAHQRQNSLDSEEDDYYDNEILAFYESESQAYVVSRGKYTERSEPANCGSALETDRLRMQLKEAYHLLINTMQDISFDSSLGVNGFIDQEMVSSPSQESVCSQLSAGVPGSVLWSSGQSSPQQVLDTDSLLMSLGKTCEPRFKCSPISKSCENLCAAKTPPLQRSISDGAMKCPKTQLYLTSRALKEIIGCSGRELNKISAMDKADKQFACEGVSSGDLVETDRRALLNESSGSTYSLAGYSNGLETQGNKQDFPEAPGVPAKPHGVTVNKMQEWMHKGRMLSSEMKQRIAGSSPHTSPNSHHCSGVPHRTNVTAQMTSAVSQQSALTEHMHSSTTTARDARTGKLCESHQHLNTITVSKKRNWLQQSLGRSQPSEDTVVASEEEQAKNRSPENHRMDLAEENDADDEGEIWYNPIPEDEEPEPPPPQMLLCKAAKESLATRTVPADTTEAASNGFSPPSSPNPSKKISAINWSLPDKIKSPRTVRKLSMKMKKLPELSRKLSVKGTCSNGQEPNSLSPKPRHDLQITSHQIAASRNVISRYHLDSSVSTQNSYGEKSGSCSKSASKGGYLSDGDSPELVAKSGKHNCESKAAQSKDPPKAHGLDLDIDAFRHYSFVDQSKCSQYISGLMNLHFYGAEDLKPPRVDSRDVYCAIQVDCVNKARTALLTCRTAFLDMNHAFNIELENGQHLKLVVFSWEPTPRKNRVCCHGTVVLPTLFRVTRSHQLAIKLEPRGVIYVKLNLMEQWQNTLDGPHMEREPQVFGVEAWKVVEQENAGIVVPLLIEKCITEIEKRGCQVVGLYRLCGSAAVKKELREAFERDSRSVELSESLYPDINVITGVLKDYLRELPYPIINKQLYEAVLDSMVTRPLRIAAKGSENDPADSEHTVGLLEFLPEVEKATLRKLLDHLKLVASYQEVNKMTCQNLAVCFGPVLLSQRQEASSHSNRVFIDSEELASALHFKKHIEVLHYLLQMWPVVNNPNQAQVQFPMASQYLRRRRERPQLLNLNEVEKAGVLRSKAGRLDSPSNRYAGDWSLCGNSYFQPPAGLVGEDVDYADVPADEEGQEALEDRGRDEEEEGEEQPELEDSSSHLLPASHHTYQAYMKIQKLSPVLSKTVNLKDLQDSIDMLIGNLERELNKNKLTVGY